MSTRAKASKAVGSVIDGRFRDVQEHRDLGFPVRTLFLGTGTYLAPRPPTCCLTPGKDLRPRRRDGPAR